jgi:serine/threonine-protein kinase
MASAPVVPGQILDQKYRIERVIGRGGMGVVVAATHLQLNVRVAIKFLKPESLQDEAAIARFFREARATATIRSEHVARVIDVGTLDSGAPYLVMEHLEGADLATLLRAQGPLSVADAVAYVLQVCEAVHQAHSLSIIHRDLKPSNVFLERDANGRSRIKVLDFGLSRVIGIQETRSLEPRLTAKTSLIGTPLYMSPEQLTDARDVDGRTDIWSIGAILFELIGGRPPFDARELPQICTLILHGALPSLSELRPDVPPSLEAVIARCLKKSPSERYADVRELAGALAKFATSADTRWLEELGLRSPTREGRTAALALLGIGALFAVAGVAAIAWWGPHRWAGGNSSSPTPSAEQTFDGRGLHSGLASAGCNVCVASNCYPEYQACVANDACKRAIQSYNECIRRADGSFDATCSENFGTNRAPEAQRLASCAFVAIGGLQVVAGKCTEECKREPIDVDACVGYCNCMGQTCRATMDPARCPALCAAMTQEQVRCRTYHCFLASQSQPEIHCEHAIGHLNMCP